MVYTLSIPILKYRKNIALSNQIRYSSLYYTQLDFMRHPPHHMRCHSSLHGDCKAAIGQRVTQPFPAWHPSGRALGQAEGSLAHSSPLQWADGKVPTGQHTAVLNLLPSYFNLLELILLIIFL